MQNTSLIGRIAAVAAVCVAVAAVAVILLSNGTTYQVHAIFQNASQIVSGDQVEVAGTPIGTVSSLALTRNGEADLTLNISNQNYDPLRQGTQATIRELSLSGIASRYVDIRPGPVAHAMYFQARLAFLDDLGIANAHDQSHPDDLVSSTGAAA